MGTIYKMTKERLKGDPYIGVSNQALETAECLYLIKDIIRLLYRIGIDPYIILTEQSKGCEQKQKKQAQTVKLGNPCTRGGF